MCVEVSNDGGLTAAYHIQLSSSIVTAETNKSSLSPASVLRVLFSPDPYITWRQTVFTVITSLNHTTMSSSTTHTAIHAEVNRLKLKLQALEVEDGSEQIYVGQYLLARLEQLGVTVSSLSPLSSRSSPCDKVHVRSAWRLQPRFLGEPYISLDLFGMQTL